MRDGEEEAGATRGAEAVESFGVDSSCSECCGDGDRVAEVLGEPFVHPRRDLPDAVVRELMERFVLECLDEVEPASAAGPECEPGVVASYEEETAGVCPVDAVGGELFDVCVSVSEEEESDAFVLCAVSHVQAWEFGSEAAVNSVGVLCEFTGLARVEVC